jgi:hypothetical protein
MYPCHALHATATSGRGMFLRGFWEAGQWGRLGCVNWHGWHGWPLWPLAAAEAGGLMPEACKLDSSSTSSGYADREISSPPPAVPAPVPRSRPPLGIGPAVGTALPRGGEEHQGLPCFHASMLVCLSSSMLPLSMLLCFLLLCFHLPRFHLPMLPCFHAVTCQLLHCPGSAAVCHFPIPS